MRNLKKILALVLALVMSFSLVSVSSAAFTDEDKIDETYAESAQVLTNLGVFQGYADGSFNPTGDITRAEVAALIYRIVTGDVEDKQVALYANAAKFNDEIPAWAAGYVGFCANTGLVKGYPDGTFKPAGKVTGFEALVMILRAIGYDKMNEFTGAQWSTNAAAIAKQLGITDAIKPGVLVGNATREVVAEILFNAITVPQVTYTPAFGYAENTVVEGKGSLGAQNFGLLPKAGVIEATGSGYVVLDNMTVAGVADASWENIGYYATVWTVPAAGKLTYTAVSDVSVIGESLYAGTDGTAYSTLLAYEYAVLDTNFDIYYNGIKMFDNGVATKANKLFETAADLTGVVGNRGVKIDFVCNDWFLTGGGKAEAVIITEYSVAQVSGITNDMNTGLNAINPDTYYFDVLAANAQSDVKKDHSTKASKLVCADELAYGDLLTYVVYGGVTYAVKTPCFIESLDKINYNTTFANQKVTSYVFGEDSLVKAAKFLGNGNLLAKTSLDEDLQVYTDPYGYILKVQEPVIADEYLFVLRTNHSDNVAGTTYATVAFADGSVENVYLAFDRANWFGDICFEMFTYTVEDGIYYLEEECTTAHWPLTAADVITNSEHVFFGEYFNGEANLWENNAVESYISKATVIVDLRDVVAREASVGTIYTGYNEIPSLVDAEIHYIEIGGYMVLGFLVDGDNANDLSKEFIIYNTGAHHVVKDEKLGNIYTLKAIVDGVDTTVELTQHQYNVVRTFGVGVYNFSTNGIGYSYESFSEVWEDVTWKKGALAITVDGIAYPYADDVVFYTVDVANGKVYPYAPNFGIDNTTCKAYLTYEQDDNKVWYIDEIYIISGEMADVIEDNLATRDYVDNNLADESNTTPIVLGYTDAQGNRHTFNYYVASGYVTTVVNTNVKATLEAAMTAIDNAADAIAYANSILAAEGVVSAAQVDEVMKNEASYASKVVFALDLLEAAQADLTSALAQLATLNGNVALSDELVEMIADTKAAVVEAQAAVSVTVAVVKSSPVLALEQAKADAGAKLVADLWTVLSTTEGACSVYGAQGDVYVAQSDVYYEIANDTTVITYGGKLTTLNAVVESWMAEIAKATKAEEIAKATAKVTTEVMKAVANAYIKALKG